MAKASADTSDKLSSEDLKQQLEETEVEEETAPVEETVEEETMEPVEETEEVATETSEEETEEPKPKKDLHRIKVEGKEEELPYEKLIEFAQKGRHYEREMSKLKEERRRLQEATPTGNVSVNQPLTEEAKEQFFKSLADDPFGTLGTFLNMGIDMRERKVKEERQADRLYEVEQQDNPLWAKIRPRYRELLDSGYYRQHGRRAAAGAKPAASRPRPSAAPPSAARLRRPAAARSRG